MTDRTLNINLGCVAAWCAWVAAFTLILGGWVLDYPPPSRLGLGLSALAATLTIRCYFVRQNEMLRNAFELGRDAAAARVTRL